MCSSEVSKQNNLKETSDQVIFRWPIPSAESIPFILNLLQIKKGNKPGEGSWRLRASKYMTMA